MGLRLEASKERGKEEWLGEARIRASTGSPGERIDAARRAIPRAQGRRLRSPPHGRRAASATSRVRAGPQDEVREGDGVLGNERLLLCGESSLQLRIRRSVQDDLEPALRDPRGSPRPECREASIPPPRTRSGTPPRDRTRAGSSLAGAARRPSVRARPPRLAPPLSAAAPERRPTRSDSRAGRASDTRAGHPLARASAMPPSQRSRDARAPGPRRPHALRRARRPASGRRAAPRARRARRLVPSRGLV